MMLQRKFMLGLNRDLEPMKVLQHGHQTTNKVLTREPMNDRLYHMNYNTSKQQRRFYVAISGVNPKVK
jgi:hypothetical protein